jgi:hypothetical protein
LLKEILKNVYKMRSSKRKASPKKSRLQQDDPVESDNEISECWGRDFADNHLNALQRDADFFLKKYLIPQSKSVVIDTNTSDASALVALNPVDVSKRLCLTPGCKRKCGSLCVFGFDYLGHESAFP